MPVPHNKKELLEAITGNYQKLRLDLESIPDEQANQIELPGHKKGTMMSICNLVSYLIGWGELVLKWHHLRDKGQAVDFPETGFKWTELGFLAQKFYADYQNKSYKALLKKLDQVFHKILYLVKNKTNKELYGGPWYGKCCMGQMIQLNTASPYRNAKARIRRWKKERSN